MLNPGKLLTKEESSLFRKLNTPAKIQDFLDSLPFNFEKQGETYHSPRLVLKHGKAHCMEGALLAAAALWIQGEEPLLLDLKVAHPDTDHVVALYRKNGLWGAISKTNHATVRFRDPIYRNMRELALSYFHEYFWDKTGEKVLRQFSRPFNLKKFGSEWITSEDNLHYLAQAIDDSPHTLLYPASQQKHIRNADPMERLAGNLKEWDTSDPRT
jgi:hypothetical protein